MSQLSLSPQSLSEAESFQQVFLGVLVIQPSPFCNINCDYCYLPDRTSKQRMEMPVLRRTFERVFESGLVGPKFQVLWHAGEPLAVPLRWYEEAFEVINAVPGAKEQVVHTFQSNGTLVNRDWCEFIKAHQIEIGLSIDGPAFIHDHHRKTRSGIGTHAKAVRGAEILKENEVPFGVVAVISDISLDHPDEIFAYFVELGTEGVGFNIEEVEGVNQQSSLEANPEHRVRQFLERVYALNKAADFPLRIREFEIARENILDDQANRGPDGEYFNLEANPLAMISVDCNGGFSTFSPELLGQVTEKYGSFQFGNVKEQPLFALTQNPTFERIYDDILKGNQKCAETCEFWSVCGGASPSNKYYENGSFDSAETHHCRCMIQMPMEIVLDDLEEQLALQNS